MKNYIETEIAVDDLNGLDPDIIISELAELGYESFTTDNGVLKAYIQEELFNATLTGNAFLSLSIKNEKVRHAKIERQNWNQEWESNYEPIPVDSFCYVRAPFHPTVDGFVHQLVITPKMSFGTGHHQTTRLMIKAMKDFNFNNLSVLDMGCGTGILAILAKKMGAGKVVGIDIDPWAVENSIENFEVNEVVDIECYTGDCSAITGSFDVILANINRNILTKDMAVYRSHLKKGGTLFVSGFYDQDEGLISSTAQNNGFLQIGRHHDIQWSCLVFSCL